MNEYSKVVASATYKTLAEELKAVAMKQFEGLQSKDNASKEAHSNATIVDLYKQLAVVCYKADFADFVNKQSNNFIKLSNNLAMVDNFNLTNKADRKASKEDAKAVNRLRVFNVWQFMKTNAENIKSSNGEKQFFVERIAKATKTK